MIRRCMFCNKIIGEKEPFENKSITDGICDICAKLPPAEIKKLVMLRKEEQVKNGYFPDNFDRDYGRAMQKDFTRQAREERFCKHG